MIPSDLFLQIEKDKEYEPIMRKIFKEDKWISAQLDPSFLGFTDTYKALSQIIPKDWTILDLGCAYAFQAYYFKDHARYIGVDSSDCMKFRTPNSSSYVVDILDFINRGDDLPCILPLNTFAICNYVPLSPKDAETVRKAFPFIFYYYP